MVRLVPVVLIHCGDLLNHLEGDTRMAITTPKQLIRSIREAEAVYAQIRFGVCEEWVKIPKSAAVRIARTIDPKSTPHSFETGTGVFASWDGPDLYLG